MEEVNNVASTRHPRIIGQKKWTTPSKHCRLDTYSIQLISVYMVFILSIKIYFIRGDRKNQWIVIHLIQRNEIVNEFRKLEWSAGMRREKHSVRGIEKNEKQIGQNKCLNFLDYCYKFILTRSYPITTMGNWGHLLKSIASLVRFPLRSLILG